MTFFIKEENKKFYMGYDFVQKEAKHIIFKIEISKEVYECLYRREKSLEKY